MGTRLYSTTSKLAELLKCASFAGFGTILVIFTGIRSTNGRKFRWTMNTIILADFGAGALLASFGGILGKCSIFQLLAMTTFKSSFTF